MKEKIRQVITELNLKQKDFAESIGISSASLSEILSGKSKSPSIETITAIHEKYSVSLEWLLTGKGTMFGSKEQVIEKIKDSNNEDLYKKQIELIQRIINNPDLIDILLPIVKRIK